MKHLLSLQSNQTWKLPLENLKHSLRVLRVSQECSEFWCFRLTAVRPLPLCGNVLFCYQECTALLWSKHDEQATCSTVHVCRYPSSSALQNFRRLSFATVVSDSLPGSIVPPTLSSYTFPSAPDSCREADRWKRLGPVLL